MSDIIDKAFDKIDLKKQSKLRRRKRNINRLKKTLAILVLLSIPLGFFGMLLVISYHNLGFDLFFSKVWIAVKVISLCAIILFILFIAEDELSKH
jgi:heme A synthase